MADFLRKTRRPRRSIGMQAEMSDLVRLMEQNRAALVRLAMRRSRSLEDAEDAVQDAYLLAYRHLGQFQGRSQLSSWLSRIVLNAATDRLRRAIAHPASSLDDPEGSIAPTLHDPAPSPEEQCARGERKQLLTRLFAQLPPAWHRTLQLRSFEEMSTRDAATELGVAEGTVKSHLFRAHKQLRRRLQASGAA